MRVTGVCIDHAGTSRYRATSAPGNWYELTPNMQHCSHLQLSTDIMFFVSGSRAANEQQAASSASSTHLKTFQGADVQGVLLQGCVDALMEPLEMPEHAAEPAEGQRAVRSAGITDLHTD